MGDRMPAFRTMLRVLTFRATRDELAALDWGHLRLGLLVTWLAGVGRYWDDPRAHVLQHTGLGSVIYVFVLSAFLWLLIMPLGPRNWSYRRLLTYVTLTAAPALLYATPVEMYFDLNTSRGINCWFLLVVATWRVVLLVVYLERSAELAGGTVLVAAALPIMGIVASLVGLNLEHAVFDIMGGLRGTSHDAAYTLLIVTTFLSVWGVIPMLIAYGVLISRARKRAAG